MEIWKKVIGYEEYYSVSNLGRVRRDATGVRNTYIGKILKPQMNPKGYLHVNLYGPTSKSHRIANLVADAFLGKRVDGLIINHIDGVKTNNCLENLEYISYSENNKHAYATGLKKPANYSGIKNGRAKLTEKDILEIRRLYSEKKFKQYELARMFSVIPTSISHITRKITWSHI